MELGLCDSAEGAQLIPMHLLQIRAGWRAAIECLLQRTWSADWTACNE